MIKSFSGRAIYGLFDLKSSYDSRILAPQSWDLTSFYMEGMGLLQLTQLPQGHTNSVAEFQQCSQHMIGTMYPEQAEVFIDDCVVKGPKSVFSRSTIPGNDQIWVFVWKYVMSIQELLSRVLESVATISGLRVILATT